MSESLKRTDWSMSMYLLDLGREKIFRHLMKEIEFKPVRVKKSASMMVKTIPETIIPMINLRKKVFPDENDHFRDSVKQSHFVSPCENEEKSVVESITQLEHLSSIRSSRVPRDERERLKSSISCSPFTRIEFVGNEDSLHVVLLDGFDFLLRLVDHSMSIDRR